MNLVKFLSKMLCVFSLLSIQYSGLAQQKNDWQRMKLRGKPKLIIQNTLGVSVPDTNTTHFSPKGYLILQTLQYYGDNYRTEYEYTAGESEVNMVQYKNGKIQFKRHLSLSKKSNDQRHKDDNSIEIITQENDGVQKKIKSDEKGNRLLYETYSKLPDGSLKKTYGEYHSYKFDKYGNWYESKRLVEFQNIEGLKDGGTMIRKIIYY